MNKQLITSLALVGGVALIAAGCSKGGTNQGAASSAASQAAAVATQTSAAAAASTQAGPPTVQIPPAQPIAFNVDKSYDPCNDFASWVNANWNEAHPIPPFASRWGAFGVLHRRVMRQQKQILETAAWKARHDEANSLTQKLGRLYAAGMNTEKINKLGYTPIKPMLAKIDALENTDDIVQFINTSYADGNGYVFGFYSHADQNNAMKQIGYITQSGLGMPSRKYYLSDKPRYKKLREAYLDYIAKSFELIGTPEAKAEKKAQTVLNFETKLAKASLTNLQLTKLDNQYNWVSVEKANKISPNFNWAKFFEAQGVQVKGFSMSQPKFIKKFNKLLAKAPVSHWRTYLKFHLISRASPALSAAFQKNHFKFYNQALRGQPQQKARWKRVLGMVNGAMGMGLGKLYVHKYFPPATKARAEKLVHNLLDAFARHIKALTWMSDKTKQKALKKLSMIVPKIGYPAKGEWRDYSGLEIQPGHFFANMQAAMKYNYEYNIAKIGTKTDRQEWHMTPQTVNAYYSRSTNTINFPAAILQPPFFYAHGDDAVNYGGIGFVMGHEMTHGFDSKGSKFNGYGDRVNWWTKEDRKKFDSLTHALAVQYDQYTPIPGKPKLHVKGEYTLTEDIADLGGLNLAWTAFQTALENNPGEANKKIGGFTPAQRFFMSSARVWEGTTRKKAAMYLLNNDVHAPAKIRAFASASNMPVFSKAFNCKVDTRMHRKNPITIW